MFRRIRVSRIFFTTISIIFPTVYITLTLRYNTLCYVTLFIHGEY